MKTKSILLAGLAAMMAASDTKGSDTYLITNPYAGLEQYGSGSGAAANHWYSSPIFIPYKHIKQTYRSQQRAAKQRRKSK